MPDDVVHILGKCAAEIEQHIHHMEQQVQQMMLNPAAQHLAQLHNLLDMVVNARVTRDNLSSLRLIRKVGSWSYMINVFSYRSLPPVIRQHHPLCLIFYLIHF